MADAPADIQVYMRVWLTEQCGFIVGTRNPDINTRYPGAFMVAEAHETSELPTEDGSDGTWAMILTRSLPRHSTSGTTIRCPIRPLPIATEIDARPIACYGVRMAISDLDIWRAAHMLIERHGAEALTEAAKMIDKMLDHGDLDGCGVWLRIKLAITELQAPPTGPAH